VVKQNMAALPIKCKALSLQEKLYVIWKVEANPHVQQTKELSVLVTALNGIRAKKDFLFRRTGDVSSNVKR
jgi:hypothetical protein